jgi:hypothetical protein
MGQGSEATLNSDSTRSQLKEYNLIAKGTFKVDLKPESSEKVGEITLGRYSITKDFQGDLTGVSQVSMVSAASGNGSGAYAAIEQVSGVLGGKKGTFVLLHSGTRTRDSQHLSVFVVPGCATEELAELEGVMTIDIVGKEHHYTFRYSLNQNQK